MSKTQNKCLHIDQWVKVRMEQLTRIDNRINQNLEKYRKRKSINSDGSNEREAIVQRQSRESLGSQDGVEYDYDEIADDWRKLKDTITSEIPIYIHKNNNSKTMNKINTVRNEADRVSKKIEARLEQADLDNYRYKQGLKKWENNPKQSKLRQPRQPKPVYEEIKAEPGSNGSAIMDGLSSIGREDLKKLDQQVAANEKLVGQYEQQKEAEKTWSKVWIILILAIFLLDYSGISVKTHLHQTLLDFLYA